MQKEYKAVNSLLIRSGLSEISSIQHINHCKYLSTSTTKPNEKKSDQSQGSSSDSNKDSNKKNEEEKVKTLLMKFAVWTMVSYAAVIYALYAMSQRDNDGVEV